MMSTLAQRLRAAREQAGFSGPHEAARALGASPFTYTQHENGIRGFRNDTAIRYAKKFRVSLEWLLTGKGHAAGKPLVPVAGYVGAGAEIHPFDDFAQGQGLEMVEPPPGETETLAVRIRGDSMHPFKEGWLVFYRRSQEGVPDNCPGELCVVRVKDGPVLVKMLRRGPKKNRWTLESWNAPLREDVQLEWASKVIDIRPT